MKANKNDNIIVINLGSDLVIPKMEERKVRNKEYISYGDKNAYPQFLWSLYNDCADHQSIVDGLVLYTIGGGIKSTNPKVQALFNKVNDDDETIDDLMKRVLLDYFIFGGMSMQIVPNRLGDLSKLYWTDFMNCRVNEEETFVYYSKEWGRWSVDAKVYELFDGKKDESGKVKSKIHYFKGNKTRGIYPICHYNAAIRALMTSVEIDNFHLNNIQNGFQASTIINFNNGEPDETTKKEIEDKLEEKFVGTSGQKHMISFNENKDNAVTVEKLDADNFDEKFNALQKTVQNTIFTAHKVTSPALFGIKMENTGFSETEFKEAFKIFNETIIKSYQKTTISELTKVLRPFFGTDLGLSIEPYNIDFNE